MTKDHGQPEAILFIVNTLRFGTARAVREGMKKTIVLATLMLFFGAIRLCADDKKPAFRLSECIISSSVLSEEEGTVKFSQNLLDEAQALTGKKYSIELTNEFADKIRRELRDYDVDVTVNVTPDSGESPRTVSLSFTIKAVPKANVNERYFVESIEFSGDGGPEVSRTLQDQGQRMVGKKFSEGSSNEFADRLRDELKGYSVSVRIERGEKPDHIKVVYQIDKSPGKRLESSVDMRMPFVYHSTQAFSMLAEINHEKRHNFFAFGVVSDADQLLERNAGLYVRYEHRKLGTDLARFRIDFESYHQKFNPATESALDSRADVPGIYRTRQNFAPSLSFHPAPGLTIRTGVSFQRFQMQYPEIHTQTAYAGIADVEYEGKVQSKNGYELSFSASYGMRTATRVLESDFVYTRHSMASSYGFRKGKSYFEARFTGGIIGGAAPLFERFSLGDCGTLRGWNKFDVAPLGATRAAHGSVEYSYSQFRIFYDVGSVWDPGRYAKVRHGVGFGWSHKGMFASLAFPVRLHDVAPVFMMGIRLGAR